MSRCKHGCVVCRGVVLATHKCANNNIPSVIEMKQTREKKLSNHKQSLLVQFDGLLHNSATCGRARTVFTSCLHRPDLWLTSTQTLGCFKRLHWRAGRRFRTSGLCGLVNINSVLPNVEPFLKVNFNKLNRCGRTLLMFPGSHLHASGLRTITD